MRRRDYLRSTAALALPVFGSRVGAGHDPPETDDPGGTDGSPETDDPTTEPEPTTTEPEPTTTEPTAGEFRPVGRLPVGGGDRRYRATEAVTTPDGRYAFVAALDGFRVVDLADPSDPAVVATRVGILADRGGPLAALKDLAYDGGRLLLANDGRSPAGELVAFDVSDPTDPRLETAYDAGYGVHNCDVGGDYAYATTGEALDGGYDTTAHNFDIVDGVLYSSWYRGGVRVHDVSDPAAPVELASWADGSRASFWTARAAVPGEFFVATSLRNPGDERAPGALYAFPDPTGEGGPSPDAAVGRTTEAPTATAATPTGTPMRTPTRTPTAVEQSESGNPPHSPTSADAASGDKVAGAGSRDGPAAGEPTTDADGPGFGVAAALGGLGLGAWRLLSERGPDGE
ncbi:MAG: LVIVD repeat-containing protein [Haloarculaceae archaeon]